MNRYKKPASLAVLIGLAVLACTANAYAGELSQVVASAPDLLAKFGAMAGGAGGMSLAALGMAGSIASPTNNHAGTKFFCIAVEGATTDGRTISRDWITQMAKNYNPAVYGARINLEHIRGLVPDSPFKAYGDVLALEAREESGALAGKLGLYAQIKPTDELIALAQKGQKIYTSCEVNPKFADTGEAYLVGLAVTDSPASLGTSVLSFAAQNPAASPFAGKKQGADNLFTAAEFELVIDLQDPPQPGAGATLFKTVTGLLNKFKGKSATDDARFADVSQAVEAIAQHSADQGKTIEKLTTDLAAVTAAAEKDRQAFADLKTQLSATGNPGQAPRPQVTGGTGAALTDC